MSLEKETKGAGLELAKNPRYMLTVASGILFLMLLLFLKDLPESIRTYTLPSLLIYTLFTALIGFLHNYFYYVNVYARFKEKGQHKRYQLEWWEIWIIISLHILSFGFFIWYNIYRGVL